MRDAFGGVFMMRLMLVFIVIFVAFSAVSLNYAKAFRIKNRVIDVVEQMEIQKVDDISNYYDRIDAIKQNANYNIDCGDNEGTILDEKDKVIGVCRSGVVIMLNSERSNEEYIYYNIITYGGWNLGSLNMLLALSGQNTNSREPMMGTWAISGEAKVRNRSSRGKAKTNNQSNPSLPFNDKINGDRCYNGTWYRVKDCQDEKLEGALCHLENGSRILRNHLTDGYDCEIPKTSYTVPKDGSGYRCYDKKEDKKENKWIYITVCQEGVGAHCQIKDSNEEVIRTYLTTGRGCTTPKPAG